MSPSGRTDTVRLIDSFFHTDTCSTSAGPIRYSAGATVAATAAARGASSATAAAGASAHAAASAAAARPRLRSFIAVLLTRLVLPGKPRAVRRRLRASARPPLPFLVFARRRAQHHAHHQHVAIHRLRVAGFQPAALLAARPGPEHRRDPRDA